MPPSKLILPDSARPRVEPMEATKQPGEVPAADQPRQPPLPFDITNVPREELEARYRNAFDLLYLLGSSFPAFIMTLQNNPTMKAQPVIALPVQWLQECHRLTSGLVMEAEPSPVPSGFGYAGGFQDRDDNHYTFYLDAVTGAVSVQTEKGEGEQLEAARFPRNPETLLWFQACMEAALAQALRARGGLATGPSMWSVMTTLAETAGRIQRGEVDPGGLSLAALGALATLAELVRRWPPLSVAPQETHDVADPV